MESGFRATEHGLRFVNRFTLAGRGSYGLCGGMVRYAYLRFRRGIPIELQGRTPRVGSWFFWKLQFHQWRSLDLPPTGIGRETWRYAGWMRRSDAELERGMALELERLRTLLGEGRPVPLGLVRARKGRGRLWHNHQVLACSLHGLDDGATRIRVYDPNHPMHDHAGIHLRPSRYGVRAFEFGSGGLAELPGWFVAGFASES